MLKIHSPEDTTSVIPFPIDDDKRYVTHRYNGFDTLTFEIQSSSPLYKYIAEEVTIEDEKNQYVVKGIDEHSDFVTVSCDIDLDDWKRTIFYEFRTTNKLLSDVLAMILPNGWYVVGAGVFTKRTTVEATEGEPLRAATPLDVLDKASSAYSCVFNFDVPNRVIKVVDPTAFKPSGQFFTDELNLRDLGFVGSSEGFATRLYAYGKKDEEGNPLTFASINDGKPYVEDYSYSNKVISVGWSDERYTNAESLLEAATKRLQTISHPSRSYECEAQNLREDVWLYKVVTLVDRRRKTRVDHQIVEYKEYPDHSLDTISLSKTAPDIKSLVNRVESNFQTELEQESSDMKKVIQDSIDHATDKITGNKGGHFVWVFDSEGKPVELLNLCDSMDLNKAKSVWRWNASGLGHSNTGYNGDMTLALLDDGSINASAITAGIMTANLIRAGKLSDLKGLNFWDLETGEFSLSAQSKVTDGDTTKTLKETMSGEASAALTHEAVFKALTKDGAVKGLFTKNGQMYVNASYLASGIISSTFGKIKIDLSNEDEPVFNTGIVTNGLRIRSEGTEDLNLFQVDAVQNPKDATVYYAEALLRSITGKPLVLLTEAFDASDGVTPVGSAILLKNQANDKSLQMNVGGVSSDISLNGGGPLLRMQANSNAAGVYLFLKGSIIGGLSVSNGVSTLVVSEINGKAVYWSDNGDGTFTLKGK